MSDEKEESGIDVSKVWAVRSAYLKYKKADWRNRKAIVSFLHSPELEVLVKLKIHPKLAEVIKYFTNTEPGQEDIKSLRKYFETKIFKDQKAD